LVYRLTQDDCHRYIYLDSGEEIEHKYIKGKLHTVRPISSKYKVFSQNSREYSVIKTKNFGQVVQIEIGALLVGKIVNYKKEQFNKFDEKGYFEYGGSTIIQLFKENTIFIDEDIINKSKENIETKVEIGEKIGGIV
jgi:phosphatidylserine decarboxylase